MAIRGGRGNRKGRTTGGKEYGPWRLSNKALGGQGTREPRGKHHTLNVVKPAAAGFHRTGRPY